MFIETETVQNQSEEREDRATEGRVDSPRPREEEFALELAPARLADVCHSAMSDVAARHWDRRVEYAPDPDPRLRGAGEWDQRRVTYAVTILLEDALQRTKVGEPVSLRWREHDGVVVLRVQYPRPLERGDRFVTYFEDGVRPDGAADDVGTLRIVAARKIVAQHRGQLARIRTPAGTAYVVTLPRSRTDVVDADDGI